MKDFVLRIERPNLVIGFGFQDVNWEELETIKEAETRAEWLRTIQWAKVEIYRLL